MVGNLRRRSMLEEPSSASSEWDFEWDYTKGPIENFLPIVVNGDTVEYEMQSDGERILSPIQSATYFRIDIPIENATCENGILEVDATIINAPSKNAGLRLILSDGSGQKANHIYVSGNGSSSQILYNSSTTLVNVAQQTVGVMRGIFRIEFNDNGQNRVYWDYYGDEPVYSTTTMSKQYASANRVFVQNAEVKLHALRYKLNCF